MNKETYVLQFGEVFTLLFIMIGPLRPMVPYAKLTSQLQNRERWKLSLKINSIAIGTYALSAVLGRMISEKWRLDISVLTLTAGIIFFISAVKPLLGKATQPQVPSAFPLKAFSTATELVITPFGVSAIIVLATMAHSLERLLTIFTSLILVILLNLVALSKSQIILKYTHYPLKLLGIILGVLQLALAVQIITYALRALR